MAANPVGGLRCGCSREPIGPFVRRGWPRFSRPVARQNKEKLREDGRHHHQRGTHSTGDAVRPGRKYQETDAIGKRYYNPEMRRTDWRRSPGDRGGRTVKNQGSSLFRSLLWSPSARADASWCWQLTMEENSGGIIESGGLSSKASRSSKSGDQRTRQISCNWPWLECERWEKRGECARQAVTERQGGIYETRGPPAAFGWRASG